MITYPTVSKDAGTEPGIIAEFRAHRQGYISSTLKVHKNENFFGFDCEFCTISLLVMHK